MCLHQGYQPSYTREAAATHFRPLQSSEATQTTPITSQVITSGGLGCLPSIWCQSTSLKYQVKVYSVEVSN